MFTKEEAAKFMQQGIKMTHEYFTSTEWVTYQDGKVLFEDGCTGSIREFWAYRPWPTGWDLFVPKQILK